MNKKDLIITVDLEEGIKRQLHDQLTEKLWKVRSEAFDKLSEEYDKKIDEIVEKYSAQVIENIKEWMQSEDKPKKTRKYNQLPNKEGK